jgi:hypothetical protein
MIWSPGQLILGVHHVDKKPYIVDWKSWREKDEACRDVIG